MKFKFELQVFQEGELNEVLETPVNEFRDATELAEALAHFALIQSGNGRRPKIEAREFWEGEYSWQNLMRSDKVPPRFGLEHLTNLAVKVSQRNYDEVQDLMSGANRIALPSAREGYSGRTHLVISKVIPVAA